MSRRTRRGTRTAGLFWQTADGDTESEARDNPRTRRCPHCNADIGQPCIAHGRHAHVMSTYHPARREEQQ